MANAISSIFKSEHAIGALYIALLGGALANALPDPTDALNFYLDRKWRERLEKKEITPAQYWERKVAIYYGLDSLWWLFVLALVAIFGKNIQQKAWIAGALIGSGAVVGMIFSNIKKDKEFFEQYELVKKNTTNNNQQPSNP